MDLLNTLVEKGLRRELPTREEALAVLATSDDELLDVVAAAGKVRRQWFGRRVKLNYLVNLKSGLCPEDCSYCSQRLGSKAEILKYTWLKPDEASQAAAAGVAGGAKRVCLVASGRGPTDRDVERVGKTIEAIKEQNEGVEVCACLGLLSDGQAERLRDSRRRRVQPQPQHVRGDVRGDHQDPHLRRPGGHRPEGARRRSLGLLGSDRGHGRDRRGPRRRRVRAPRARLGLGAGQLPHPLRGHPARQGVEPHPAALPADPGDGAVRLPRRRGADRGRPRGAPAVDAAAGAEHRELDLPRRLPDERGPGPARPTWT